MSNLDVDEQAILASYENGEWHPVPLLADEVQRYRTYAAGQTGTAEQVQIRLPTDSQQ